MELAQLALALSPSSSTKTSTLHPPQTMKWRTRLTREAFLNLSLDQLPPHTPLLLLGSRRNPFPHVMWRLPAKARRRARLRLGLGPKRVSRRRCSPSRQCTKGCMGAIPGPPQEVIAAPELDDGQANPDRSAPLPWALAPPQEGHHSNYLKPYKCRAEN